MDTINHPQAKREAQRMLAYREELVERIGRAIPEDGVIQPLPKLYLARRSTPLEKIHIVQEPSFCVIAQGSKVVFVGDTRYQYDPFHYLLAALELPRVSQVLEASTERPYLSFRLELDPTLVGSVMVETGHAVPRNADVSAMNVSPLDADLLDAVVRLVRLVNSPAEALILMPLVTREIVYRLLIGDQGGRLRHLTTLGGYSPGIARAVKRLRQDFDKSLRIEEIASELGMSVSSFHHHFKAVTAMSSSAIPEAAAVAGGPPSDAGGRPRCGQRGLSRGLQRCLALQSGVQKPLRRPTDARRAAAARRNRGKRCRINQKAHSYGVWSALPLILPDYRRVT